MKATEPKSIGEILNEFLDPAKLDDNINARRLEALYTKPRKQTLAGLYSFIGKRSGYTQKLRVTRRRGRRRPKQSQQAKGPLFSCKSLIILIYCSIFA